MSRFVVRPTGPYESDGYSVVDTNREDSKGQGQIGRGLTHWQAVRLATMLDTLVDPFTNDESAEMIREVLAACADAHDDYLSDEEQRANRKAHEKSAEQARKMPAALREIWRLLDDGDTWSAKKVAREALGE